MREGHDASVELLDDLGAEGQGELTECLGVGNFRGPHPGELPIDEVRTYLALEHGVAPVAQVLEQQQPQDHLGRGGRAPPGATVRPTPREGLVDDLHELPVAE